MTKSRTIVAVALAAGTFGGTIGAVATAAIQSQAASPEAIAAAVQRVSDSSAEQSLRGISTRLGTANVSLHSLEAGISTLQTDLAPLDRFLSDLPGSTLANIARNLELICDNTASSPFVVCSPGS